MEYKAEVIQIIEDGIELLLEKKEDFIYLCTIGVSRPSTDVYYTHSYAALEYKQFILDNKPTPLKHPEFFNHPTFSGSLNWWNTQEAGVELRIIRNEQRRLFLEKLLKQLKE